MKEVIKKITASFVVAVVCFCWALNVFASSEAIVYINKDKGFSIEFPGAWEKSEGVMGSTVAALSPQENPADQFRPNVNVIVKDLRRDVTLEEYMQAVLIHMTAQKDFQVHEKGRLTISNSDARWLVYSQRKNALNFKVLVYVLVQKRRVYQITCTATLEQFSRYRKRFEGIAQTFKFE